MQRAIFNEPNSPDILQTGMLQQGTSAHRGKAIRARKRGHGMGLRRRGRQYGDGHADLQGAATEAQLRPHGGLRMGKEEHLGACIRGDSPKAQGGRCGTTDHPHNRLGRQQPVRQEGQDTNTSILSVSRRHSRQMAHPLFWAMEDSGGKAVAKSPRGNESMQLGRDGSGRGTTSQAVRATVDTKQVPAGRDGANPRSVPMDARATGMASSVQDVLCDVSQQGPSRMATDGSREARGV